jgi:hypothetical protein
MSLFLFLFLLLFLLLLLFLRNLIVVGVELTDSKTTIAV